MFSRFFIERPIFSTVISIVIVIAGAVSQLSLPIAKFPDITPPTVQVTCFYPGANAKVVAETVAAPIEQEVNGVEDMLYMASTAADDGSYVLNVTFEIGTDMDMATVLVQNRVSIAESKLPEEVRRQGVTTKKQSTAILQFIVLSATDPRLDDLFLSNYALINIKDELSRIKGVGAVNLFGAEEYSMRVWLDPAKLKARQLTTEDVVNAIREQNVQVAAGRIGEPPAPDDIAFQLVVNTQGRLLEVSQFEDLIVKAGGEGRVTRVRDVARVERGAKNYNRSSKLNGQQCASLAVYQLPGANALEIADQLRATMKRLSRAFPQGMEYSIPFDTTMFVDASIHEVYKTLGEAVVLVIIVIFLFLQDWRATLIPCAAIPVSLIGTFAFMSAMGFSINMLTLFGIVLAIGIVVDDAIVVVENTATKMEHGMAAKEAAIAAMEEITAPVIAITLVLLAVFVPTAFMGGITGQLYRQFALTISAAVAISALCALTLSPALCAMLLRPAPEKRNVFFRMFNTFFDKIGGGFDSVARLTVRRLTFVILIFAALVTATGWGFMRLPTGFLPVEDQGYAFLNLQLPDGATLSRTQKVLDRIDTIVGDTPGVADRILISGFSILTGVSGSNNGFMAIVYKPWDERLTAEESQEAIIGHLRQEFAKVRDAVAIVFPPPSIDGLGNASGFQLQLQDRGNLGLDQLQAVAQDLVTAGNAQTGLQALNTTFRASVPQLFVDIDRTKVKTLGVPLSTVFNTLQAYLGSTYVNDFNQFGRTYQVRVQADQQFRMNADAIKSLDVRNANGDMLPMGTFVKIEDTLGPQMVQRYNMYTTAQINGEPAPGFSSGQAMSLVEQMADETLPPSMGYEWTGISFQEKLVGNEQYLIFALAIVLVYLVLAAQYESWTSPAAVIAVVPLAALGVVIALFMRGADNNVYTQVGVVLLIALASKNAILIVEFAIELRHHGKSIVEAATQASKLRFRAIVMTSIAAILGFIPLLTSTGAGAASRQAVGNAVVGGMTTATVFSLLFVPAFFVIFRSFSEWTGKKRGAKPGAVV
ncbi:MAG: multidrug efflux RND transporter permease subunit [Bythopirellula sp.]|nr:multidrug efflux RND transporter permease subunit [Bythopirellula sp.]